MMKEKVVVALSGGVDSTYAAWLLMRQGYEVTGVCLDLFEGSSAPAEAMEAAEWLGVKVIIAERRELFRKEVADYKRQRKEVGSVSRSRSRCYYQIAAFAGRCA